MSSAEYDKEEEIESSDDHAAADEAAELDYEAEEELGSVASLQAKLKKLRLELAAVKKDKAEYLDGWQRCKADIVNARRENMEAVQRAGTQAKETFVEDLIPALDSFDMAMAGDAWHNVESAWRTGVEGIRAQIASALQMHGVESYGAEGDSFDPSLHEAIEEVSGGATHTIAKVLRKGYRINGRIIRAAHVRVYR